MKRGQSSFLDRTNILAFIVMLALAAVSLLAQSNANYYAGGDYYQRQVIWIVIGGAVFFGAAIIDLRLIERAAYMFYAVCVALLVLTLLIGTAEEQVDLQPCGGTHVARTGEIGAVRFGKVEKKGKLNRRVNIHFADS